MLDGKAFAMLHNHIYGSGLNLRMKKISGTSIQYRWVASTPIDVAIQNYQCIPHKYGNLSR